MSYTINPIHTNKYGMLCIIVGLICIFYSPINAQTIVKLSATEREPYIGPFLKNRGYVHELVKKAFEKTGYQVKISFFPLPRTKKMAEIGQVDGYLPAYYDHALEDKFLFSIPFPGDSIGLLKKKALVVPHFKKPQSDLVAYLRQFKKYTFGVVRGDAISPEFDQAAYLTKQYVREDLQNLDKLEIGRIDFAVIDKYTASDLMVNNRPHLIGKLEFIQPYLVSNQFHVAFSKKVKNHRQLSEGFNRGLSLLEKEGAFEKILAGHGFFPPKKESSDSVKLSIGTVNNRDMLVMKGLSQQFMQIHPNIVLEWKILDENTLRKRLLSDLAISDGQFDIMTIGAYETPIWAKRKWLTPLILQYSHYDADDLLIPVKKALSYRGQLYALPFYAESSMLYYRKDLFQQAGLTMPGQPTYNDIKKFAAALHHPDGGICGICLRGKAGWGENMALISTMVNTYGGRWFDEKWHPTINSQEWKDAISTYIELIKQYGPKQAASNGFNENLALFADGRCAMWIDATIAAGKLFNPKASRVHDKIGYAPAPIAITPKGANWLWIWALAIPQSAKHKQEALQFIEWATSKAYIEMVGQQEGWVSAPPGTRKSTYTNKSYQASAPFAQFVYKSIESTDPNDSTLKPKPYAGIQFVDIPEFPAIGHQVGLNIVKVIEDQLTIDQALSNSQEWVEDQMQRAGYSNVK